MNGSNPKKNDMRHPNMTYPTDIELDSLSQKKPVIHIKHDITVSVTPTHIPDRTEAQGGGIFSRWVDGFRRAPNRQITDRDAFYSKTSNLVSAANARHYDLHGANTKAANTALARELKGRHLQMIAIGGSIGTGLFVASGLALNTGGPGSLLFAFIVMGIMQYCTMQALGELVVAFPVAGSFSSLSTRFIDPSWGFAMGWNYALQWLVTMPLEVIAGAYTTEYWNKALSKELFVTIFLLAIVVINLLGIRGYGEAEFIFSIIKVAAVISFILLGIVINIGGQPGQGYIGGKYWQDPGAFNHGFKGFCSVLVTAAFSFAGTEMVGLAAAETVNPRKSLPTAIKQVFWRISLFYIGSLAVVGLLVPYDEPRLLGAQYGADATASPFVIAIESAGTTILPSIMNAVILIAVISVGNSAVYASTRTLAALAEQSLAPKLFTYVDRRGRPLAAILFACAIGLLAYLCEIKGQAEIFNWLFAISGLSTLFTWASICLCHIRFRKAWQSAGYSLAQLPFKAQVGVNASKIALAGYIFVLLSQVWIAVSPVKDGDEITTTAALVKNFLSQVLAIPIVFIFWLSHKLWFKTAIINIKDIDIDTGRRYSSVRMSTPAETAQRNWPRWKRLYRFVC